MAKEQDVIQLPFKITEFNSDMVVALDRNFKEIERQLSSLQLNMKAISGGSVRSVVDTISTIEGNAQLALANAADAQETADGQIQGFFQAEAPVEGMTFGDIWIDIDGHNPPTVNDIYRYEDIDHGSRGALAWRSTPTNAIGKVYLDAYTSSANLTDFIDNTYSIDIGNLQNQIDGVIATWFYNYAPTLNNLPASGWSTDTIRDKHLGDLFYDTSVEAGHAYRFAKVNEAYQWIQIADSDVTKALADAAAAQDTADNKRRVFTIQPYGPYDVGDLWTSGPDGDLKRCITATATANYFSAADWELASKYTDDTKANQALSAAATAQETADGLIQGFFQPAQPSANMSFGDIWIDTDGHIPPTTADIYRYEDADHGSQGTLAWRATPASAVGIVYLNAYNAQTTANTKIKTFYQNDTPTASEAGDFWIDTNDNNHLYRWDGTNWVTVRDKAMLTTGMGADNDCTALFHFNNDLKSHKGLTPTFTRASVAYKQDGSQVASGVPRYEDGKFGQGIMVEEGTTNLLTTINGEAVTQETVSLAAGTYTISNRGDNYLEFVVIDIPGQQSRRIDKDQSLTFTLDTAQNVVIHKIVQQEMFFISPAFAI